MRDDSALQRFAASLNETLDLLLVFALASRRERRDMAPMLGSRVHELQVICTHLREYLT